MPESEPSLPPADEGRSPLPEKPEPQAAGPTAPPAADGGPRPHASGRVVGRTPYDFISDFFSYLWAKPRVGIPIVLALLGALVVLFLLVKSDGIGYESKWFGFRAGRQPAEPLSQRMSECFALARERDRPYTIEAVTYLIRFELEKLKGKDTLHESHRIVYTMRARRAIKSNEGTFEEEIRSHRVAPVFEPEHWYGTETEDFPDSETRLLFHLLFDMESGDTRTVVTGADFYLPTRLGVRPPAEGLLPLGPSQIYESYPNAIDVICELNMVIESKSLDISPTPGGTLRVKDRAVTKGDAKLSFDNKAPDGIRTISARWQNIVPNETVGIHFSWTSIRR